MSKIERKTDQVRDMFNGIAPTYDMLNHILSMGIDKLWRKHVVGEVKKQNPKKILDVATGTCDLIIGMAKRNPQAEFHGVDLSSEMLRVGALKVVKEGIASRVKLMEGNAEELSLMEDATYDVITVAFGVRNFAHREKALQEFRRVLKDGGKLVILEFSNPANPVIRVPYLFYSHKVLPFIGGLISKTREAYEYLPNSVDEFPSPEKFKGMLRDAGFSKVDNKSQSFGIAQIYLAFK